MSEVEQPRNAVAGFLLFVAIALYVTVSSSLLVVLGVPYDIPGGNVLLKIHPGTYVFVLAYFATLASASGRPLISDFIEYPAWLFYGVTVILLIAYSGVMFGAVEAAFIPETLLMPLIVAGLMSRLPVETRARAFVWTIALLSVNAAIAIGEALTQTHLIPYLISGRLAREEHFRATALGGHPLANALVTVTYMFAATLFLRKSKILGASVILLFGLAVLAFGGRVAFVVAVAVGGLWLFVRLSRMVVDPAAGVTEKLGAVILAVTVLGVSAGLVVASELGGRIFHGFRMDASARSRLGLFDVFSLVDAVELLFGVGPGGIERFMRTLRLTSGLTSTIENFWVLWILSFGVIGFVALTITLFWFFRTLLQGAPPAVLLSAMVFLIAASGNNSLGTKNRGLTYLVIAIMGGSAYAARATVRGRNEPTNAPRRGSAAVGTLLALALAGAMAMNAPQAAAAEAPMPSLKRGVNLSHWQQYQGRQPIVPADLAAIRARGFDHVRLPFDPARFGWQAERDGARKAEWGRLDRAVGMAIDAGLTVLLDFHPNAEQKSLIERDPGAQSAFVAAWRDLAARYRTIPADRLAFELLNEPEFTQGGAAAANDLKRRTIAAVREVDPGRLLLLASIYRTRTLDQLAANEVVSDRHVLYVFHFYDPHILTHFGASWGSYSRPPYALIETIRYPAARMAGEALSVRDGPKREDALRALRSYIEGGWNGSRIEAEVAAIAAWARGKGVGVICTEFGVIRTHVDDESRLTWLRDARAAFERHDIPWTVWDYADVFGIAVATGDVRRFSDGAIGPRDLSDPRRRFDAPALEALGLGGKR